MNQNLTCKTVQELEEFLREHYHAEQIEPVEYLLYNARQQVLNLFYPEQMQQISEQVGFSPEADEEISALFDRLFHENYYAMSVVRPIEK